MRRTQSLAISIATALVCGALANSKAQTPSPESTPAASETEQPEQTSESSQGNAEGANGLGAEQAAIEPESFEDRVRALRLEHVADGWLDQAERAHRRAARLREMGDAEAADRAQRIALAAVQLAEKLVRRERLRARAQRIRAERRQIAASIERAESALTHLRQVRQETPPDPNAPEETEASE